MLRKLASLSLVPALLLAGCGSDAPLPSAIQPTTSAAAIQHVVVIFGENVSFDHYFGTYPNALNLTGETAFTAASGTTVPDNYIKNAALLTANPNLSALNGAGAANPFRLSAKQALTADQDHGYTDEQSAFDSGAMDKFPASVGTADTTAVATSTGAAAIASTKALTMGFYY